MSLFTPKTANFQDFYEKGRFLLVWRLNVVFVFIFAVLSLFYLDGNPLMLSFYIGSFLVSLMTLLLLYKCSGFYKAAYWIFNISASIIVSVSTIYVQEILHYADLIWMICIVTFAFVGSGKKAGVFFLIYHIGLLVWFILFGLNANIEALILHSRTQVLALLIEVVVSVLVFGYLIHQHLIFQDYARNKLIEINQELMRKNETNSFLLREVHHRVKNNLQIIVSMLKMQRDDLSSEESRQNFSDAINRIMIMSLVHDKLYNEKALSSSDLRIYVNDLVNDIVRLSRDVSKDINVKVVCQLHETGAKTVVPLGLLLNELLTNSFKHAFLTSTEGEIEIRIEDSEGGRFTLMYSDSGNWKESSHFGFGLELIELLTDQMEGELHREGSRYEFTLTKLED